MDNIILFLVKANVTKLAKAELVSEDTIIDSLTQILSEETANVGTDFWLDTVINETKGGKNNGRAKNMQ